MPWKFRPEARWLFLAGQVPPVADATQPEESVAAFGDTYTQTVGCLQRIKAALIERGYGIGDVVNMTA